MSAEWVLIRGLMSEPYHWWDFLPLLAERLPGRAIHTPNILGCGATGHLPTPTTVAENLKILREQIPGIPQKRILFGFSLGGMLALEWAHAHPDEVSAIVLVNCSLSNSKPHKRFTPFAVRQVVKALAMRDPIARERTMLALTAGLDGERLRSIAPVWHARGNAHPVRPLNFFAQIRLASRIGQRAVPPPVPILILSSGRDRVVHPDCSRKLSEVWNLPIVEHPEAGHDLTLNDPEWVIEQLAEWAPGGLSKVARELVAEVISPAETRPGTRPAETTA